MWQKIKHLFKRQTEIDSFRKYDEALAIMKELAYGYQSRKQYNNLISKAQQYLYKYDIYKHYEETEKQNNSNEVKIGNVYRFASGASIVIGREGLWDMMKKQTHYRCYLWDYRGALPELWYMDEEKLLAQPCYGNVPVDDFFWQAKAMVFNKTGWLSTNEEEHL